MTKIILFDMDGTLIDSTDAIYESFCVVFEKHKMPPKSKAEVAQYIGYPLDDMFAFLGAERERIAQLCADYKAHYMQIHNAKTKMLDGAVEAIKMASEFASLGIVTTKSSDSSRKLLAHFGVAKHFSVMIGKNDVINPKPHKEPILKALAGMQGLGINAEAHNAFMIGDTILDLIAAKDAGIIGLGVLCGYGLRADLEQYSKFIFKDTMEAVKFAKRI